MGYEEKVLKFEENVLDFFMKHPKIVDEHIELSFNNINTMVEIGSFTEEEFQRAGKAFFDQLLNKINCKNNRCSHFDRACVFKCIKLDGLCAERNS